MRKRGFSALEALVSLLLLALVLQAGWTLLARQRQVASRTVRHAEGLETVRTVAWILSEDVVSGRPGEDWALMGSDTVALRAFRGLGLVQPGSHREGSVRVCYRGLRAPNPEKDSVLLLGAGGGWFPVNLVQRSGGASPCPGLPEGREEEWTLVPQPAGAVLGRIFERGSYHLADGAFRYRRGFGGRQPLTPALIQHGEFRTVSAKGLERLLWEVVLDEPWPDTVGVPWVGAAR